MDNIVFFAVVTATACVISGCIGFDLSRRNHQRSFVEFILRLRSTLQYGGHGYAIEMINGVLDEFDYTRKIY